MANGKNKYLLDIVELGTELERAQQALRIRRYDLALQILHRLLQEHPENSIAFYTVARVYMMQEQYAEASKPIQEALRLDPSYANAHALYGVCLQHLNSYEPAEREFLTAIGLEPESDFVHFLYAEFLLSKRKDVEKAKFHAYKALALEADDASHHDLMGRIFMAEKNIPQAEAAFLHALRLNPERELTHNNYGVLLMYHKGEPQKAFEHFRIALMQNPTDKLLRKNFLQALKAKHRFYWLFWQYAMMRRQHNRLYILLLVCVVMLIRGLLYLGFANDFLFVLSVTLLVLYLLFILYVVTVNPLFNYCIKRGWIK